MKQYNPDQLREVLNYDSNQEQCFGLVERSQIHRAISLKMDGYDHELPLDLHRKIKEVRAKIKTSGFQPVEISYYLDQETMHIKSKTLQYE